MVARRDKKSKGVQGANRRVQARQPGRQLEQHRAELSLGQSQQEPTVKPQQKPWPAPRQLRARRQPPGVHGFPARTRAADILRHVGLEEERYRPIGQYSTGMKQRVKLAQSLAHDPVIVLLDEPTAGLDPGGREDMLRLIRRTGHEFGISIILSSHLMGDVESTCDRIIVLEGGRVTEQGAVSQFTQETETVLIDVDGNREELITALAARGVTAVLDGVSLAVELDNEEHYDAIRDSLVETNARLRRMSPRRHQLTDIFRGE